VKKISVVLVIFWSELANKLGVIVVDKLYTLIGSNLVMEQFKDNKVVNPQLLFMFSCLATFRKLCARQNNITGELSDIMKTSSPQ
jgi:hypothetical protein